MGCNCGANKATAKPKTWTVISPTGEKKSYRTEVEAIAAAKRNGGTYKAA